MRRLGYALAAFGVASMEAAAAPPTVRPIVVPDARGDIPAIFTVDRDTFQYLVRDVSIPMRDGVKLHARLLIRKGLTHAPMMLDRTPYGTTDDITDKVGPNIDDATHGIGRLLVDHGYIVVIEDVRGKYSSNGPYFMNRPLVGPMNTTTVDNSTDAWDTIDWLSKNVPESNGRVGTIGGSYDGFTVLMSLVHPHPALRAAVPMNPMVDTWRGDDWFHMGAFREGYLDYIYAQTATTSSDDPWWTPGYDQWDDFLGHVSASGLAQSRGMQQLPFWHRLVEHSAYDAVWQDQAVDRILAGITPSVPTLWVSGQWDQEDSYGAVASFEASAAHDTNHLDHLVVGPWYHGQQGGRGSSLGPLEFGMDTSAWFQRHLLLPFLDAHLKDGGAPFDLAPAVAFQVGTDTWRSYASWPPPGLGSSDSKRMLYLQPGLGLGFSQPPPAAPGTQAYDEYVADPAKPVPYRLRPIRPTYASDSTWRRWLVDDQRFAEDRPDVLAYVSAPLTKPLVLSGAPVARIYASTTGTDADWIVKLIDVYPNDMPDHPELGSYELPIGMDILRGRYRNDPAHPSPIPAKEVQRYTVTLPNIDYVVAPGHRLMVQVQSSWYPLYDRNPQTYVSNIFLAQPGDYRRATNRVFHVPGQASAIELPVVSDSEGKVIGGT